MVRIPLDQVVLVSATTWSQDQCIQFILLTQTINSLPHRNDSLSGTCWAKLVRGHKYELLRPHFPSKYHFHFAVAVTPILLECLEPPDLINIERSFKSLCDWNFITNPTDDCEITQLGSLVVALG
jgi:hypothetical protein